MLLFSHSIRVSYILLSFLILFVTPLGFSFVYLKPHYLQALGFPLATKSYLRPTLSSLSTMGLLPYFPAYSGPYSVGSIDIEVASADLVPHNQASSRIPETVACRVFYPAEQPEKKSHARPVYWIQDPQKDIVSAYGRFLGVSPRLATAFSYFSQLIYYVKIPVLRNAKLLHPPQASQRWPVMVFSHGLGGMRNSYSHICGSLASYGMVVYAMDHRDGSSPIQHIRATETTQSRVVDYKSYSHQPSPDVYDGRDEQLKIRLSELSMIHEVILRTERGEEVRNLDPNHAKRKIFHTSDNSNFDKSLLSMFAGKIDVHTPGKISWAGHSFGAATTVQFVKSVYYHPKTPSSILVLPPSDALKLQITQNTPVVLLDPWGLPLQSPATAALNRQPMPMFANPPSSTSTASPVLAILSSAFYNWSGNLNQIKAALRNPNIEKSSRQAHIFYPMESAHLSQSDFGILFPNITKYVAKAAEPERTMRLNVRAILETLRQNGVTVADTTPEDMELTGEREEKEATGRGDWKILSTEEGAVRGWVSVPADEVRHNRRERNSAEMSKVKYEKNFSGQEVNGDSLGDDELNGAR